MPSLPVIEITKEAVILNDEVIAAVDNIDVSEMQKNIDFYKLDYTQINDENEHEV